MRKLIFLLAGIAAGSTHASTMIPADGVWQIAQANGSGLTLDIRDSTVGIGLYTYDDTGASVWYSGAGQLVGSSVTTSLAVYREGATPGSVVAVGDPRPLVLNFAGNTHGTMSFNGTTGIQIQHAAFGADYVSGWTPQQGGSYPLPDLRGRWLFATRTSDDIPPPRSHAVEFAATTVDTGGDAVTFRSIDYPVEGSTTSRRIYEMECGPQPTPATRCLLSTMIEPLSEGDAATVLGDFDPRGFAPNQVVGTTTGGEVIGFRLPTDFTAAPSPGIWQIVGRSGSGLTLDVRENGIAVGLFTYDSDGKAVWSLAQGEMIGGTLSAPLLSFSQGSCLGCPAKTPVAAPNPPTMSLQFIGATRALLTIGNAAPLPITLLPYGLPYAPLPLANDSLQADFGGHVLPQPTGRWVFSQGDVSTARARHDAITLDYVSTQVVADESGQSATSITTTAAAILASTAASWDGEFHSIDCATFENAPEATCELRYRRAMEGSEVTEPPITLAAAAVSDMAGNRILAMGAEEMTVPVWGFRIPPRPAAPAQP